MEVLTDAGGVVGAGTPLFKLKIKGQKTLPYSKEFYTSLLRMEKKIKKGMEALVVPSTVQPQEYGFMEGKVTYVSDFPITERGMMTSVKNDQLAKGLLASGTSV